MRPKRPDAPKSVREWCDAHRETEGATLDAPVWDDAPDDVRAHVAVLKVWLAEHEAWSAQQPIDESESSWKWRMYGGPWMYGAREFAVGELRWTEHHVAQCALAYLGEERFRAWAAAFYERERMIEASARKLAEQAGLQR